MIQVRLGGSRLADGGTFKWLHFILECTHIIMLRRVVGSVWGTMKPCSRDSLLICLCCSYTCIHTLASQVFAQAHFLNVEYAPTNYLELTIPPACIDRQFRLYSSVAYLYM